VDVGRLVTRLNVFFFRQKQNNNARDQDNPAQTDRTEEIQGDQGISNAGKKPDGRKRNLEDEEEGDCW